MIQGDMFERAVCLQGEISVSPGYVQGAVTAPASKSMMQRAIFAAALAPGKSELANPAFCADAEAALGVVRTLGAACRVEKDRVEIAPGGEPQGRVLDCGESGLCLRMTAAVASLQSEDFEITGRGSLCLRPVDMIVKPLRELGVVVSTVQGRLPVRIKGPLQSGVAEVDGSTSSQFLSGLLMALPLCGGDSVVRAVNLKSKPYIRMTLELLSDFGIQITADPELMEFCIPGGQQYCARRYAVEGDWSAASFMLVAGAIAGEISVTGLAANSAQADRAILEALSKTGAGVVCEARSVKVEKKSLFSFEFDATDCPDLFPPLVALALNCSGKSVIRGVSRLAHKESDRAGALLQEFKKLGGCLSVRGDQLEVVGGRLTGGAVSSHNDHRIAMALAVAALNAQGPVRVAQAECVAKSYPSFFYHLESLRGQ